tara:strand:- start:993 stop:1277 length:285 start_codon:yes stop_codon:yes gene_type:complete
MKTLNINKIDDNNYEVIVFKEVTTRHLIHLSDNSYLKYSNNSISKEQLIKKAFLFLLSKEKNTSILDEFDIDEIENYFPEFSKISEMGWLDIKV